MEVNGRKQRVRWLFVVIGIVKMRARMPGWLSVSSHTQYILVVYYMCYRLVCNVGGRWGWWWVRLERADVKQRRAWRGRGALVDCCERQGVFRFFVRYGLTACFPSSFPFLGVSGRSPVSPGLGGGQRPLDTGRCRFQRHGMAVSSASSGLIRPPVVLCWVPRRLPSLPSLRVASPSGGRDAS